jgi:CRISPR-associated endonuclease/helicase Cas3
MVQFLNTLFGGKTQQIRRFQALTNSVIIIDEIQSLPVKTINMFNATMNFLKIFGSTIILCSATQPLLSKSPIPITVDGDIISDDAGIRKCFKRNEIIDIRNKVTNCETIADFASELTRNYDSGIIIVNTKLAAFKIYNLLKEKIPTDVKLLHISTNMCPAHQKNVINEFKNILASKNQKVICVSTPVLEAGVDISAEWVIRSITGWDSVMQSAGRCNRNGEYAMGYVYLVKCQEENINSLIDIKIGRECTENALRAFEDDNNRFDNDLMSNEFVEYYFERYSYLRASEMNYSVKDENTNIFEMLSLNEDAANEARHRHTDVGKLTQAFKKAGNSFEVITQDMQGVIAPYGDEGKKLISDLAKMSVYDNPNILLKKAQKYSVNLYRNKFNEYLHENIIYRLDNFDVYCLIDEYYDKSVGINKESVLDDLFF